MIQGHAFPAPPIIEEGSGVPLTKGGIFSPKEFTAEPPLSLYEAVKGETYTIKYFGLQDRLLFIKNPEFDISHLGDKIKFIENFVRKEIERKHLYDSPESYRAIMKEFKEKLHITSFDRSDLTFDKIYKFIKTYRGRSAYGK